MFKGDGYTIKGSISAIDVLPPFTVWITAFISFEFTEEQILPKGKNLLLSKLKGNECCDPHSIEFHL